MTAQVWFVILNAGIFGCFIGSFLNVCIHRLPRNESVARPPSRCYACGARVQWYDNIPVFSWLILRGRCRFCGSPFSIRYPLGELSVGILTAVTVWWAMVLLPEQATSHWLATLFPSDDWPWALATGMALATLYLLWVAAWIDYDHTIIPDEITMPWQLLAPVMGLFLPVAWTHELVPVSLWATPGIGGSVQFDPWVGTQWVGGLMALGMVLVAAGIPVSRFVYTACLSPSQRWEQRDLTLFARCAWWFVACQVPLLIALVVFASLAETAVVPGPYLLMHMQWGVALLGQMVGWLSLYLIGFVGTALFKRNAMGYGDVKFLAPVGALIGPWGIIMTFFAGAVTATIVGLPRRLLKADREIPFGPFLAIGVIITIVWGEQLVGVMLPSLAPMSP